MGVSEDQMGGEAPGRGTQLTAQSASQSSILDKDTVHNSNPCSKLQPEQLNLESSGLTTRALLHVPPF